ncbi:hypothetical protein EV426DRAFT_646300 [Tirmania nivea]|nr:hypothetical protein EV426DRAFT_646300 [Tirmania nivea]
MTKTHNCFGKLKVQGLFKKSPTLTLPEEIPWGPTSCPQNVLSDGTWWAESEMDSIVESSQTLFNNCCLGEISALERRTQIPGWWRRQGRWVSCRDDLKCLKDAPFSASGHCGQPVSISLLTFMLSYLTLAGKGQILSVLDAGLDYIDSVRREGVDNVGLLRQSEIVTSEPDWRDQLIPVPEFRWVDQGCLPTIEPARDCTPAI